MTELETLLLKQLENLNSAYTEQMQQLREITRQENESLRQQVQLLQQDVQNMQKHYVGLLHALGLNQNLQCSGENALAKSLLLLQQLLTERQTTLERELNALELREHNQNAQQQHLMEQSKQLSSQQAGLEEQQRTYNELMQRLQHTLKR